jgi:hypothetical protein
MSVPTRRPRSEVFPNAYQTASRADSSDLSGSPRGEPWDDESQKTPVQPYRARQRTFR